MTTYTIPPGAWLSGSGLHPDLRSPVATDASWHPDLRRGASLGADLHPDLVNAAATDAGWHPDLPPAASNDARLHPDLRRRAALHQQFGRQPWRGCDPEWVYDGGPQALLAQALERSHSRIARPTDPRRLPRTRGQMAVAAQAFDTTHPLWRWGSEFRVQAIVGNLCWRLRVDGPVLRTTGAAPATSLDLTGCKGLPNGFYEKQIDRVQRAAIEREDRLPEILAQRDDFRVFFRVLLGLDGSASPLQAEVLAVAWEWATPLVMALKHELAALRPVQRAPSVMPVIPTPAHGALPSGHATMAALTAEILTQLRLGGDHQHRRALQMDRLARRIAFNRVVAGVHFPLDSAVGYALGLQLAGHFVGWATGKKAYKEFTFSPKPDTELTEGGLRPTLVRTSQAESTSATLALLWNAAQREAERGGA